MNDATYLCYDADDLDRKKLFVLDLCNNSIYVFEGAERMFVLDSGMDPSDFDYRGFLKERGLI